MRFDKMSKDTKILFMHNAAMWYRIPFFRMISEEYDLKLVFTHIQVIEDIYDDDINSNIQGLEDVDYSILANSHGFAKGLISKAFGDYDILVGGSWDTLVELIETLFLFIITKLRRKAFIIWREEWGWRRPSTIKEKGLETMVKFITRHIDAMLVPGLLHKQYFNKTIGVAEDKIHIMPNVSNISDNIQYIQKEDKHKTVLYVGRLIERKGVIYLLEAFNMLNDVLDDVELIVIGSGEDENKLSKYVQDNNMNNVVFTGRVDNEKLREYYIKSNLVVVPSINHQMADPWVFVLNEAMYYCNPIIATDAVGAAPDMIVDNGYIVEEQNSGQLYDAMLKILSDNDLEKKMSRKSYEIIKDKFQYSNMLNSFKNTIDTVLKNRKSE